jgi:hypothetical protein
VGLEWIKKKDEFNSAKAYVTIRFLAQSSSDVPTTSLKRFHTQELSEAWAWM